MFYPMFAMFILIFVVGIVTARARFGHVRQKKINPKYFLLFQGDDIPEEILKTGRNFSNQFEIPVLFFVVCLSYMVMGFDSMVGMVAAWVFIFFRAVHAYIHITSNNLIRRMQTFWLGFICVLVMWIDLFVLVWLNN